MTRYVLPVLLLVAAIGQQLPVVHAQYPGYGQPFPISSSVPKYGPPQFIPNMFAQPAAVVPASSMRGGLAGGGTSLVGDCSCGTSGDGTCDGACGCDCSQCCEKGTGFQRCWHFFSEFLYLRARDSEVAWITPANSNFPVPPNPAPVQIGPQGVLDMDYQAGYRAGLQYNMTECTGISIQYTMFEATTNDFAAISGANLVESLVSHPAIDTTARNFREGTAAYDINYDMIDVDYHELLWYGGDYQVGYLLGANVVQLEQTMTATFAGTGTETVATDIDFYGAGLRFGLAGDVGRGGQFRAYGKAIGSLVAGEFRADYDLGHSYDAVVIDTAWRAGRVVGIWNLELGMKWISCGGSYRANLGYVFSAWTNTVQTDQWVHAVQNNSFIGLDDTMTFDGLVARFEGRF